MRRLWSIAAGLAAIAIAVLAPGLGTARNSRARFATVSLGSAHELVPLAANVRLRLEL